MAHRTLGRALTAVALTATLALALPAQADAAPLHKSVSLWEWVSGLLEGKIAGVWGASAREKQPSPVTPVPTKQGGCVDPNGCAASSQLPASPPKPLCAEWSEQGGCVDPNG